MAFVRTYRSKKTGRKYRALVESYRDERGRVRQRMLKWLGPVDGYYRGSTAYDVQGAFMLGLPFRIVYEVIKGDKLAALREKLARPAFVPWEERKAARGDLQRNALYGMPLRMDVETTLQKAGWSAAHASSITWNWREDFKREGEERSREDAANASEFQAARHVPKHGGPPAYRAEARYMDLREEAQRQWTDYKIHYGAKIAADVERTHAANMQYARENNLNAPAYGIVAKDASRPAEPSSSAEDGASSNPQGDTGSEPSPDASPSDESGSSAPS